MTNKPKHIGTAAEVAVADYLTRAGMRDVRRIAQAGANDLGDVHYWTPRGRLVVVSVKGGKMAEKASQEQVRKWLGELERQADRVNPGSLRFLVTKRAGIGALRPELWRAHGLNFPVRGVWSCDLADMVAYLDRCPA